MPDRYHNQVGASFSKGLVGVLEKPARSLAALEGTWGFTPSGDLLGVIAFSMETNVGL